MITLTDNAAMVVSKYIHDAAAPVIGLRISVEGGGCSGLKYSMRLEENLADGDQAIDCKGVTLLIDGNSATMLNGVTVDFVESMEGSGFKFENPNASGNCGCGKSFAC